MGEKQEPLFRISEQVNIKITCQRFDIEKGDNNRCITWEGLYLSVRYDLWNKCYCIQSLSSSVKTVFDENSLAELATLMSFVEKAKDDFESVWNKYPHPVQVGKAESYIETPTRMTPVAVA